MSSSICRVWIYNAQYCFIYRHKVYIEQYGFIYRHLVYIAQYDSIKKTLKNTLWPLFLWMGFDCLKTRATSRRQFTFYHLVPRNSWYSFCRPRKDERLSRSWGHPVVLKTGPLDWESSDCPIWLHMST